MRDRVLIIVILSFFHIGFLCSQCIEKDSLLRQLDYLGKTSSISDAQKIKILLDYAERIKKCNYKNDSTHCLLLTSIGELYYENAEYLKAIQYYRQVINIIYAQKNNPAVHPKSLVRNYYLLSKSYASLNDISEQLENLDSAASIAISLRAVDLICLWSLYCRIVYFYNVGDYHRCIEYADLCERLGKEYATSPSEKKSPGGLSYASGSLQWNVNALLWLTKYNDAERLLLNRLEEYKKDSAKISLGVLYEQLAEVLARNKKYKESLFYFQEAFKKEAAEGHPIACKTILNNIGYFIYYLNDNKSDSALYYYKNALLIRNKEASLDKSNALESLNIFNSIADVFVSKGLFDSAYSYFQLAFDQIKPGTNEREIMRSTQDELINIGKIRYLTNLFIAKGTAYHQNYKTTGNKTLLHEALRIFKLSDQLLDRIKASQNNTESKLFWRGDIRRLYEEAIEASFSDNNLAGAFYFFEKSRAIILIDQLNEQHWVGESDISKQTQLRLRINFLEKEIGKKEISPAQINEGEINLFSSRQELDALNQKIKIKNPLYYQNFIDSSEITLGNIEKQILKDYQAIIEIYAGDRAIYELVISKQKNYLRIINKTDFDRLSQEYVNYISDPVVSNRNFDKFIQVSLELYQLLFKDMDIPPGRIIISPDGHYFPFESLITSYKNEIITYLMQNYAVSYTYSARYLLNDYKNNEVGKTNLFIGIAPVKFKNHDLPALPGSDISLGKLGRYFKGDNLINEEASKSNFLQNFYSYKIIQLYTHASDSGYSEEPVIWFADSSLSLSELIYEHKPATKLIVLSACETGKGQLYQGEGVFSFNRAFAALGIPSSISSLWSVDNNSTYRITELFYKYLAAGLPTDVALQKAKLEFISTGDKNKEMPYYWAASIFIGINESFGPEKRNMTNLPMFIAVMVALVCIMFFVFYRRVLKKGKF